MSITYMSRVMANYRICNSIILSLLFISSADEICLNLCDTRFFIAFTGINLSPAHFLICEQDFISEITDFCCSTLFRHFRSHHDDESLKRMISHVSMAGRFHGNSVV